MTRCPLVKDNLADFLEIINGRLKPGQPIVESKWAGELSVAQASVREALNILTMEGFVQKRPGCKRKTASKSIRCDPHSKDWQRGSSLGRIQTCGIRGDH